MAKNGSLNKTGMIEQWCMQDVRPLSQLIVTIRGSNKCSRKLTEQMMTQSTEEYRVMSTALQHNSSSFVLFGLSPLAQKPIQNFLTGVNPFIPPSIIFRLFRSWVAGAAAKAGRLWVQQDLEEVLLVQSSGALGCSQASQETDSAAFSWSTPGSPLIQTCQEHLPRQLSRGHPYQMPKLLYLNWLYSESLLDN